MMDFSKNASLHELLNGIYDQAAEDIRYNLSKQFSVGPFNDEGVAEPGKEFGQGFAIFIGEWRLGWWKTRSEACEVCDRLCHAVREHPLSC